MSEPLLLPSHAPLEAKPGKPIWRPWKWIALALFVSILIARPWLPGIVVVLGWLIGIVVLANLGFLALRLLKNWLFWRVRNRIVGSFVFVGLIPLLLLAGVVYLTGYLLLGQLSADYLDRFAREYQLRLREVNRELSARLSAAELSPPRATAPQVVSEILRSNSERFPRLAARLIRRTGEGRFEQVWRYDPASFLPADAEYPAQKWISEKGEYEGILVVPDHGWFASLRPLERFPGYLLEVTAPLGVEFEEQVLYEKSIFVSFEGVGHANVNVSSKGVSVDDKKKDSRARVAPEADFEASETQEAGSVRPPVSPETKARRDALVQRRMNDTRRMITFGSLLRCREFRTGKESAAGLAIIRVPVAVVYQSYLGGTFDTGQALLRVIYVLCILFAFAELTSLLVGAAISRRVTKSVDDIYRGILALQKGDLGYRIPTRKNDQLGLLAHAFNQMTGSITRLLDEVTEKKRLEQELEIAREVQATLFPKQLPKPRGLSVFGGCEPARVVSGDYYDFIVEDELRLHIVVGDISGKGISAALLMANLQAAMRNQLLQVSKEDSGEFEKRLPLLMEHLNDQIFRNSPSEKYATLFLGRYDAAHRRLCYCNAGHLAPFLLSNGTVRRLELGGTVLGLFERATYQAATVDMEPGSLIAVFTDGVTEAVNEQDEEFGEQRLLETLREVQSAPPELIYRRVVEQVGKWQGNLKQHDDITLIVARVS